LQMEELEEVISCSNRLGVRPILGLRAKMSTKHNGHWGNTSGDNSKFGLTVNEIVAVVHRLRQEGMLDCLQLLHFHIGSQISSILTIKEVMREGSHTYCELAHMGAPMVIPTLYTLFLK
jgi:arginine decarboxylase-like protein